MELLVSTWKIGIAKVVNHPEAKVGDEIQLTDEEIKDNADWVDPDGCDLYMVVTHILEDTIIGDLAMYGEVAGMGFTVDDSPFW